MSKESLTTRLFRRWHKRLGVAAAFFFGLLALSGVALNHVDVFELDTTRVATPWLMSWYGLKPAVPQQCFRLEEKFFCWQGDVWAIGGRALKQGRGEPVGAVHIDGMTWVATAESIFLYDVEGNLVDKIERELLPDAPIRRLGVQGDRVTAAIGNLVYNSVDGITWERLSSKSAAVTWSRLSPLPESQQRELTPLFAPSLPLQRIVADLHSGHILGLYGVIVIDALAMVITLLAISGVWMFLSGRGHRTPHRKPVQHAILTKSFDRNLNERSELKE